MILERSVRQLCPLELTREEEDQEDPTQKSAILPSREVDIENEDETFEENSPEEEESE